MDASVILRGEAVAAGDLLQLLLVIPVQSNLRANRAAIAFCSFERKFDPVVARRDSVLIDQKRAVLIRYDHIERSSVPKICERDRAAVIPIGCAHSLRNIKEPARTVIEPHVFLLITREATSVERRPVGSVANDRAVAAGHFCKVVPVAALAVERDIAVYEIKIEIAVIIQIAKLRTKAPSTELYTKVTRKVVVFERRASLRNPEIVALNQHAFLRDIRNIDGKLSLIEDVAEGNIHPALGRKAHSSFFAAFVKVSTVIEIKLRDAVVIRDEEIGMSGTAQIGRGAGQRPAVAVDAGLRADLFKAAIP